MAKEFVIKHQKPIPLDEQETVITYDKALKEWTIFTDNPSHARKYEETVIPSENYPSSKTYHIESGELIGIEGTIDGSVGIRKKTHISAERKKKMSERMKEYHRTTS